MTRQGNEVPPRPPGPLGRGMVYSLGGVTAPMVMAVAAIPLLAQELGAARFGILALAWTALAYLALLNLGVGRALVHATASRRDARDLPDVIWTAVLMLVGVGLVGGLGLFSVAPWLASGLLRLDGTLAAETTAVFRLLAVAVPFTVSAAGLSAVLEGRQRFGTLTAVSIPLSAVNYLGPLLALRIGEGLPAVLTVLVFGRIAVWGVYLVLCLREVPEMRGGVVFARRRLGSLLKFGGWVSVSQVASPLMIYADRFVIAAALSAVAVAYYATPQEAMLRLGTFSGAVAAVLYPAFAASSNGARLSTLMKRGAAAVYLAVFPLALVVHVFAGEILQGWMGPEYAAAGSGVLRWLAVGVLVNGLAKVAASFLVGRGRPDIPARLHLLQLPLYAGLLGVLVSWFGITGAAAAWVLRVSVDGAALYWFAARRMSGGAGIGLRVACLASVGVGVMLAIGAVPQLWLRAAAAGVTLCVFGVLAWTRLLGPGGRRALRAMLPAF